MKTGPGIGGLEPIGGPPLDPPEGGVDDDTAESYERDCANGE